MKRLKPLIGLVLCAAFLWNSVPVRAFETDQYDLPPEPLADIGDEVTEYVADNLRKAIEKLNAGIARHQACLDDARKSGCDSAAEERAALAYLRSEAALAKQVFKPLGGGIPPFTNSDSWIKSHKFKAQPALYKTSFSKSIYRTFPSNYFTISETVNLFGVNLGIDKIAHIFQQGYTYYKTVEDGRKNDLPREKALKKAVDWGRISEKTYYGYWVSGIYSNGDLAANYAGMKFYEGLTREIEIAGRRRPPVVVLKDGLWTVNENVDLRAELLRPFISDHLNEALNPSHYANFFGFRSVVRGTVKKQACAGWRKLYPDRTAADFEKLTADLKLWFGEDYGHKDSPNLITIANTCF
ncbi:MAG: hypothetical protein JSS81_15725 [Acidobacteria bacterium]|nr:hypothetical protein [Acidobacteriota bacterium]